jgi:uncharacterized protein YoxC
MELISDILLAVGALGAAFYCISLGRRLTKFNDLKEGVGGAVAILSVQVDDLTRVMKTLQSSANGSVENLNDVTARAEEILRNLELQVASLHDLPKQTSQAHPVTSSASKKDLANSEFGKPMFTRHTEVKEYT